MRDHVDISGAGRSFWHREKGGIGERKRRAKGYCKVWSALNAVV